ncbi:MAG: PQQ-like beta-propeller repeat protein [Planctomycetota bacterium]|nr:PQQ-like beta-propeller repeat protein [Planctomycetota bacterium]
MTVVRSAMLLVLVALLGASQALAQTSRGNESVLLPELSLNRLGLTRSWWAHAVTNRQRDRMTYVTADEDLMIAQSSTGIVSAFDPETGRLRWFHQVGATDSPAYPASFNDSHVFILNAGQLIALNRKKGDVAFALPMPGQANASAVADEKQVYVGCLDGSMFAFDLAQITELHRQGRLKAYGDATVLWRYRTSKPIASPAVLQGSHVVFSSLNGSVYSVAALNRKLGFQFETDAELSAPMVRYKDLLILASEDFNVYAIDMLSGRLAWQFTTGMIIKRAPVVIENDLYVIPEYGSLYKVNAATGERLWKRPGIKSFLAATPQRLYVVDQSDNLRVLSRSNGDSIGQLPLQTFKLRFINSTSDRIFLGTESGLVTSIRERDREFPTYYQRPERQPISPAIAPDGANAAPPDAGLNGDMNSEGEMPAEDGEEASPFGDAATEEPAEETEENN